MRTTPTLHGISECHFSEAALAATPDTAHDDNLFSPSFFPFQFSLFRTAYTLLLLTLIFARGVLVH